MTDSIEKILNKPHALKLEGDTLCLSFEQCDESDLAALASWLEQQQQQAEPERDYSPYFEAIIGSKMYKPANPNLAIYAVAKAYQLDAKALTKAFKQR